MRQRWKWISGASGTDAKTNPFGLGRQLPLPFVATVLKPNLNLQKSNDQATIIQQRCASRQRFLNKMSKLSARLNTRCCNIIAFAMQ